jgi:hypothetical protein
VIACTEIYGLDAHAVHQAVFLRNPPRPTTCQQISERLGFAAQTTGGKISAYMALEQSAGKVTGSAGGSEKMLFKISKGSIEGDRLDVEASPKEGAVLRFILTVKGDVLEGDVEENGRNIISAPPN